MSKRKQKIDLKTRSGQINFLEKFCQFLEEEGYIDIDWRTESPFAIDKFMARLEKK